MTKTKPDPVPSKIRAARLAAGLTIPQLAVKADVAINTLYFAERAPHLASERTLGAVARVLRMPVKELQ